MIVSSRDKFITHFNESVPNWKKLTPKDLSNKGLSKVVDSIANFIDKYNLDPKRLVKAVIKPYYAKHKKYPNILLYKGGLALSLYKQYELPQGIPLSKHQKILVSVEKSKILLKNLEKNGIIIGKGIRFLEAAGKLDPYFLLAYGLTETVAEEYKKKWKDDVAFQEVIVDHVLDDRGCI